MLPHEFCFCLALDIKHYIYDCCQWFDFVTDGIEFNSLYILICMPYVDISVQFSIHIRW